MFDFTPVQLLTLGFLLMAITVRAILIGSAREAMHPKEPKDPPIEPERGSRRRWTYEGRRHVRR